MEWFKRMSDALEYIEDHLEESFDMAKISRIACSSPFHFQRMFHMLTGITVAEYVRKRKLTLAAQELAASKAKVLDIALKYGYDTPESFSKAFRRVHGVSPSVARKPEARLRAYPRISFQISLKGEKEVDYRIVEREAFKVAGKALRVSTKDGDSFKSIPQFWSNCYQDGTCEKLCSEAEGKDLFGICLDMSQEQEEFTYIVAIEGIHELGNGFVVREIPSSTWAVFTSIGPMPSAIQKVWERIFKEWFPATGYEHAGSAELEVYPQADPTSEDYRCEVWIPIVKK